MKNHGDSLTSNSCNMVSRLAPRAVFFLVIMGMILSMGCGNISGSASGRRIWMSDIDEKALLVKEGYIRGTVKTELASGRQIQYDINYTFRTEPSIVSYYPSDSNATVRVVRCESMEGLFGNSAIAFLEFQMTDSFPNLTFISITKHVSLSRDTVVVHNMCDFREKAEEMRMTKFEYDKEASLMRGSFVVTTTSSSTGNSATATGSFETAVLFEAE